MKYKLFQWKKLCRRLRTILTYCITSKKLTFKHLKAVTSFLSEQKLCLIKVSIFCKHLTLLLLRGDSSSGNTAATKSYQWTQSWAISFQTTPLQIIPKIHFNIISHNLKSSKRLPNQTSICTFCVHIQAMCPLRCNSRSAYPNNNVAII